MITDQLVAAVDKCQGLDLLKDAQKHGPDLLILELGSEPEEDFTRIDALLKQGKVKEIFLLNFRIICSHRYF